MSNGELSLLFLRAIFVLQFFVIGYYTLIFLKITSIRILKYFQPESADESLAEQSLPEHIKMS